MSFPVWPGGSPFTPFGMYNSHAVAERTLLEVLRPQGDSYRGVGMFAAGIAFVSDFRGQMSLPGENFSLTPKKKDTPKTGYKNKKEDPLWLQNSQKCPQNPALTPYMQKGPSVHPPSDRYVEAIARK
jgi:hypothetical protein